jgi:transposase-like protein
MTTFNEPQRQTEEAARAWFEMLRWPDGVVCPHCGSIGRAYARSKAGLYRCAEKECRKDFTVRTKSVLESSHIPLRLWAQAFTLICSSKKGLSAHQVHRTLKITYKSAWFLCHRIREAMRAGNLGPLGGDGGIVEADETYYGPIEKAKVRTKTTSGRPYTRGSKKGRGPANKRPIVALVERGGNVRTFHVPVADKATVSKIVTDNIARESRLHTDESRLYPEVGDLFQAHKTVKHTAGEYVRYDHMIVGPDMVRVETVHTNSAEGYFSIFKRGMRGVYQHCKEKHLHRYLAEFDFRYNHRVALGYNDGDRAALAVKNAAGKRLTYRQPH